MMDKEKLNEFLEELSKLSSKYGLVIGGCGCCGSPWVEDVNSGVILNDLEFENNKYKVSHY